MRSTAHRSAFTLIELLIVIGIIMALAGLLFPLIGRAQEAGKRAQCLNNVRQLTAAWLAYAADNGRHICTSGPGPVGWLGPLNPNGQIRAGKLWPYINDATPYRCPDDKSDSKFNPSSYAANGLLSGKLDDITNAATTFVFIEQALDYRVGKISNAFASPIYPSYFYNGVGGHPGQNHKGYKAYAEGTPLSFADGHAIFWLYSDSRTGATLGVAPNSPDVFQLERWSGGPAVPDVPELGDPSKK